MAIEKNSFKVSRFDSEFSPNSRESMSSEDDEILRRSSGVESDDDDEFNDCDSGAGSDDFDLLELGEVGEEFCQVGDQTCSIPFELYDLMGLGEVLSMDVWNECLTEEERFSLTKYLPDMDQEMFMRTLKELFTGSNLHFGSPLAKIFDMLKGGLCEPRVALYRQGLMSFQKRQHYHLIRKHHNSMVINLYQIRDAWLSCSGYSIEEKLQVLNIVKNQKSLMYENMEELESDTSERKELGEGLWSKRTKARKSGPNVGMNSPYGASPALNFPSHGRTLPLRQTKLGKQNPKGTLKLAGPKVSSAKEIVSLAPSTHCRSEMKSGPSGSSLGASTRPNKASGFNLGATVPLRNQMRGDDDDTEKTMYEVAIRRERNISHVSALDKAGTFRMGKKREALRDDEHTTDNFMDYSGASMSDLHAYGSNRTVNKLSDIKVLTTKPSKTRISNDTGKKVKYPVNNIHRFPVEEQMKYGKIQPQNSSLKGSRYELFNGGEPFWHDKGHGEAFSTHLSPQYGDLKLESKNWKVGRDLSDVNFSDRLYFPEYGAKPSQGKIRANSVQNGGQERVALRGSRRYAKCEETESDSSEPIDDDDEDEDDNPLMRSKLAYPREVLNGSLIKSSQESKKTKIIQKDKKGSARPLDRLSQFPRKMGDICQVPNSPETENDSLKAKQKGRMNNIGHFRNSTAKGLGDCDFSGSGRLNSGDEQKQGHKFGKKSRLQGAFSSRFHAPPLKSHPTERKQKGEFGHQYSVPHPSNLHDYALDDDEGSPKARQLVDDTGIIGSLGKKGKVLEAYGDGFHEMTDVPLSLAKKLKINEATFNGQDDNVTNSQHMENTTSFRKRGKRKIDGDSGALEMGNSEPSVAEMGDADVELEPRIQKKPFTLIMPTVHSGFSFSVIHLLSAVRMAMVTLLPEDSSEAGEHLDKIGGRHQLVEEHARKQGGTNGVHLHEDLDINKSEPSNQLKVPSLTVQEIVNRVRSNPGDPCILETQEPLQDLVRGVLKIFSSKTAPLGAKGWKSLVSYEKSTKCWSWTGPVPQSLSDSDVTEEVTSPEAWRLPHKMLVKLVDAFANWLKSGQETLQQIGSLPAPPSTLMQFNLDEKERFRDLRAQKSLTTISPSSEEVRAYFRREEFLRYSIPDRAFSYTAVDGRKSIVAPLRRCGGKPTSKARDHFMLKRDRPPHVTILCLVRDAAARLPGSIGTRADVCTLIRDSQYIVEDVSDAQVNQVVSGALDRLHYERDPCVQFDGDRKLWVYLHRDREEEDFEDDGTSSTKKWKRQKKEAPEPFEQEMVTVAYQGGGDQIGVGVSSDLNVEPSCMDENKRMEPIYYDGNHCMENNVEIGHGSEIAVTNQSARMTWESLGSSSMPENKFLCQENSTNDNFDDETFVREPPDEFLSTSLS